MAQTKVTAEFLNSRLEGFKEIDLNDENLIDSFQLNSSFDPDKHLVELHIYTLGNTLLRSVTSLSSYNIFGGNDTKEGSSTVYLNPEEDSKSYGYPNGGIKLAYLIINNLFSDTKFNSKLYIEEISNDRTELRLNSVGILPEDLKKFSLALKEKLDNSSNFKEFRLNFGNNIHFLGINIDFDEDLQAVNVKLYEPLPQEYTVKTTLELIEYISEPISFEIDSEFIPDEPFVPKLREANFNVDLDDNVSVPSQYFNFDELFSYKVNNSNYEVMSMFNEKSAEISIDYGNYSDFIHFSSAEERLINFKYKLDLINSYETSISNINSDIVGSSGTTNNASYYENLIKGVVDNFDHYERFLYFESGSYAWPKLNNSVSKPYTNQVSSTPEAVSYFTNQRASASNFDLSNFNALVNTIPSFIREDENNAPYNLFVNMLGQHFDNLYIYSKAVSDKYNADNRLRVGVSRDLVEEAIKSLGVKLYNSSNSLENLFKYFVGEITSGSGEVINNEIRAKQRISGGAGSTGPGLFTATISGSASDPLQYFLTFNNLGGSYNNVAVYEEPGGLFSSVTDNYGIDYFENNAGSDVYLTISRGGTSIGPFRYIAYSSQNAGTDGNLFISAPGSIFTHTYENQNDVLHFNVVDADGNDNTNAINALPGMASTTVFIPDDTEFSFTISDSITSSEPLVEKDIPLLSQDLYQKSVYKRIYHNLPFLLKTKGTQRGIRALINCFGIPTDILDIKTFVGKSKKSNRAFFGEAEFDITQLPGIRLDNTGSLVEGNTLSKLTSIVKTNEKYTQDLHNVEIGFSPSDNIDKVIRDNISIDFNLDHFLGDPRNLNSDSYDGLVDEIKTALSSVTKKYNVKDFIRLIKFFDNVVFKMVKDFLPARSNIDTGVIIKPHLLDRSKYKSVDLSGTRPEYSGSVDTAFISGSSPGVYEAGASGSLRFDSAASKARAKTLAGERGEVSTRHILNYVKTITNNERTDQYRTYRGYFDHGQGESKYDGELKNSQITVSSGELNDENPYKQIDYPNINYDVFIFKDLPITICSLTDRDEVIVLGGFDGLEDHYINISPTIFENITGTTKFYENLQFNNSNQPINEVDATEIGNNQAYPGQLFIEAAAEPPKYVQYQEYTIQAYDSEREGSGIDLAPSCASERTFKVVRCRLRPLPGGASNYFVSLGDIIAPQEFFIGTQVNTEFTIKANGDIVDPEEYEITTNEVLLEAFDNHDPTCTATVTLSVDTCPVTARSTLDVRGVPPNNTVHVPASFQGLPDNPDSDQSEYKFYIGFLKLSSQNNFIPMSTSEIESFLRPPYENRIGNDGFVELYADTVTNQGANGNHIGYRQFPILKVNLMDEMFTSAPGATFDTFGNQQGGSVVAVQFMARKIDDPICSPKTPVRDLNTENYQSIVIQKVSGMRGSKCSTCNVNTLNTNTNVEPQFTPAEFFEAFAVMIKEFTVNDDPPPSDYTNLDEGDLEDLGLVTTISNCARAGIVPYRELNSAKIQYNQSINQGEIVTPNGTSTLIPRAHYTNPPVFSVNDTDDVVVYRLKDQGTSFNVERKWHIENGDVALSCEGTGPGEGAGLGGQNESILCYT